MQIFVFKFAAHFTTAAQIKVILIMVRVDVNVFWIGGAELPLAPFLWVAFSFERNSY